MQEPNCEEELLGSVNLGTMGQESIKLPHQHLDILHQYMAFLRTTRKSKMVMNIRYVRSAVPTTVLVQGFQP